MRFVSHLGMLGMILMGYGQCYKNSNYLFGIPGFFDEERPILLKKVVRTALYSDDKYILLVGWHYSNQNFKGYYPSQCLLQGLSSSLNLEQ